MADESITFELGRHVSDIIGLIERNTCQSDFIQFRLDRLYNTVVRYCDNIPSGEAVMARFLVKTSRFKRRLHLLTNEEDHALLFQRISSHFY